MRLRALAYAIVLFSALDLIVLSVAPVFGWVPVDAASSTWTAVVLALAFLLALLAMIGSISVLATDLDDDWRVFSWSGQCGECGRSPEGTVAFCHHCGASG